LLSKGGKTVVIWRRTIYRGVEALCGLAVAILLAGCPGGNDDVGSTTMPPPPHPSIALRLEQVNAGLSFPLFLTAPPNDMLRLFVVEKGGRIRILNRANGAVIATFLDISSLVSTGSEQGLLGLAFDPQYDSNRRFYVSYTDSSGNSVIARYLRNLNNANLAVGTADLTILVVGQPFTNHNGGMIAFGADGFLYVGLGDGGSGGDPGNRAQNMNELLGKLLRIDINSDDFPEATRNYAIPASNPFAGQAGIRGEIWSLGLRNPWRFSFDRQTGDLYVADVGQGDWEEVNASTAASGAGSGINYGWRIMEGMHCFNPASGCNMTGLTLPVVEYEHPTGCSVTGGYVYRGSVIPALQGTYFYGDFCAGFVRSFRLAADGSATEESSWPSLGPGGNITSFGQDTAGELYIMTSGGGLFRIVPM
jgi:glucose/arabinose dehydrogenase